MPVDRKQDQLGQGAARLVKLAREELGEMSARRRLEGYAALEANRLANARPLRVTLGVALALTLLVGGAAFLTGRLGSRAHSAPLLSYAIEGRASDAGEIEGDPASGSTLRFSDGTEVTLSPKARAVVRSIDEHGARFALHGKADVRVVRWPGAHWLIEAGPFLITVKGTAFTADWRESEEQLEVVLRSGSVAVSGPLSDEAIALRAGQRLVISARQKEAIIRDIGPESDEGALLAPGIANSADDADESPSSPADAPSRERRGRKGNRASTPPVPVASVATASRSWAAELASGHFDAILQQAEQRGIEASLIEGSSDDLAALADAARYRRRDDLARRTLGAERRRFPGTSHAHDAAFLLGRLEETAGHADQALSWYEQYLKENSQGTYTAEALGRKMTVMDRLYGRSRAKPVAEEYLRRFGDGTYAAAARALAQVP